VHDGSTSAFGTHRLPSPVAEGDVGLSAADTLLREELPRWIEQLSEEVLSVYRATEIGKADRGRPLQDALRAYFVALAGSDVEARAVSRHRMAVLYARAGLDLSPHFEVSARLFALVAERAALRWHKDSHRLVGALVELQRRLWDEARLVADVFVHARERHLGQLVKQLSVARSELTKLAHDDPLTGVRNRAYLIETLSVELERAHRYREPFSLFFADLDHFKSVNDAHGHEAGDQVLGEVAKVIKRELRPQDVVGRYGGDEFVVGLIRANGPTARRVAERLRSSVEAAHLSAGASSPLITLSIGVVTASGEAESVVELIRKADAAMYAAKAAGRNQVRVVSPP
jgi:diguanylate cyclase (GGDEF)-like protein